VRQLLVHAPVGWGSEVLETATEYGAVNCATYAAEDHAAPIEVTVVHVPTPMLGQLVNALQQVPDLRVSFSPENTLALRPPFEQGEQQAMESGTRSPFETLLDSVSSISSLWGFFAYTLLASVLVWIGLLTDTGYLLVAAMLVAPFAGPAVNGALGAAHGDLRLFARGVARFAGGLAVMIVSCALLSLIAGQNTETALMGSVSRVAAVAVLLPLVGGCAAAVHLILSQRASLVTGAAVGTLVAAALAPSAGTAGMALSMGMWGMAGDAMFELALQLVGILLSGAVVFRLGNRLGPSAIRAAKGRAGVYPLVVGVTAVATLGLLGLQASSAGLTAQRDVAHARTVVQRTIKQIPNVTYVAAEIRFAEHGPAGRRTLLGDVYAATGTDRTEPLKTELTDKLETALDDTQSPEVVPLMNVSVLTTP